MLMYLLSDNQLRYYTSDLSDRQRIDEAGEAALRRSGGAHGDVSPRIASLPLMLIQGEWREARELALQGTLSSDVSSEKHLISTVVLAQLAHASGDWSLAWEQVHRLLPAGLQTPPGYTDLEPGLSLIRVAVSLCLDDEDVTAAQAWLDAHDRWMNWSGAVLGRTDGQVLQARYHLLTRDLSRACVHARRALELAGDPRQPLTLLSAHRTLGEMETSSGRFAEAREHLDAALALADSCAAPYERALALLAVAELDLRTGAIDAAYTTLGDARAILSALDATPALARAVAAEGRLSDLRAAMTKTTPAGLSPREIEVLRLLATGRSNREIAETFFLSVRTVERHITNLYAKIGAESRAEAIAYAHEHHLV